MKCTTCDNLEFVRERDGLDEAIAFARQAITAYRKALLTTYGLTSRRLMIEAYLCAKRFVLTCQQL